MCWRREEILLIFISNFDFCRKLPNQRLLLLPFLIKFHFHFCCTCQFPICPYLCVCLYRQYRYRLQVARNVFEENYKWNLCDVKGKGKWHRKLIHLRLKWWKVDIKVNLYTRVIQTKHKCVNRLSGGPLWSLLMLKILYRLQSSKYDYQWD